ncbi:hypothetical protein AK830_g7850 [Neonectria ditissima]|uniref:Methyltransferase type 11 domain-containing protein n=1 Tax=Neonectria ditissima TaxID=78410 RepID=A0A0P7AYS7_9HYPO|nr:hypothetical protein AK830_g7850 [Neonectria ditissima]
MSQLSTTEKTFSAYNSEQGKAYAKVRRDYHPSLYQTVLDHHTSTGGHLDTLIDVGCGPGLAARALAPHFAHVVGLDPSEGMIATARSLGGVTSTSEPIRYELSTAEHLGRNISPPIADSSIDLITASNAAHWFDMAGFWPSAARVLKPGGSVALWTSGDIRIHSSQPNAEAIQAAMDKHNEDHLVRYYEPGNILTRNRYSTLPLPWTLAQPVGEFDEASFLRKDWAPGEVFFTGEQEVDLDMFEKMITTGSPQTRWHQAHPQLVGTDRDVVKVLRKNIERLLHEAGVEKGKEVLRGTVQGTLLIVKKKESNV